ncbi:hypothetical protein CGK42_20545 [Vibrio parahaemolyticus]|uniref:condensation domain-containing protein n=1 Tax=Vibrio parahaemolyticus TaxID=670 RepID=UPI00111E5523|nr:condensation domain-containing protein [Vibrio parahaemolyticus]TNZ67674.1 hypothetical protein CGK42_20545 [Vibrio parahaemolyticus]
MRETSLEYVAMKKPKDTDCHLLSLAQEGLLRNHYCTSAKETLNLSYAVLFPSILDVRALRDSLERLIERHEPLRTSYHRKGSDWIVAVADKGAGTFSIEDLRDHPEAEAWNRVHEVSILEAATPFDPQLLANYRVRILFVDPESTVVIVSLHHVTADAWSMTTFCREWSILYDSCVKLAPSLLSQQSREILPPISKQCIDGALSQRRWIASDYAREQEAWWKSQALLAQEVASPLQWDLPRLPVPYLRTSRQVIEIPCVVDSGIKDMQSQCGVSAFEVLAAALSVVLASLLKEDTVIIGSLVANRRKHGTKRCLGAFYNTVPYVFRFDRESNVWELVEGWREKVAEVDEHQELPFPLIAKTFSDVRAILPLRLCQIMLYFDRYPAEQLRFGGISGVGIHYDPQSSNKATINTSDQRLMNDDISSSSLEISRFRTASSSDLSFFIRQGSKTKTLSVFYKTDLIKDETVVWLVDSFFAVIQQMAEDRNQTVSNIILSECYSYASKETYREEKYNG